MKRKILGSVLGTIVLVIGAICLSVNTASANEQLQEEMITLQEYRAVYCGPDYDHRGCQMSLERVCYAPSYCN
jgi:hypothetical protein